MKKENIDTTQIAKRVLNLIILDESGSMHSIKTAAVNGMNETLQSISNAQKKHEDQEHFVSLVTFNDDVKTIYECVPVDEVKELTADTYQPDCCTALYDAMGISLNALRKKVAEDDKVLVTVVTDGYENASKEYSGKAIKALVDELKAKGWVFAYIGANQDVEKVAGEMGIRNSLCFSASAEETNAMFAKERRCRSKYYSVMCAEMQSPSSSMTESTNYFADCDDNVNEDSSPKSKSKSLKDWLFGK
mgnify:CR=1 FL=1